MSYKNMTINELTNIETNFKLGIKARECAKRMYIGKDKVYAYYKKFEQEFTVLEIYNQYLENRKRCGRKPIHKLREINYKLDNDWSLDAIAGRDKLNQAKERCSTQSLYNMVKKSS